MLRFGKKGDRLWAQVVPYVTSRAIQERLDAVCEPDGWQTRFTPFDGGFLCELSIYLGNGEWVTKSDGAERTDIEPVKGGISGALKRAAVHFGIGRDLYSLPDMWAEFNVNGPYSVKIDDTWHKWSPPALPGWAPPEGAPKVDRATGEVQEQPQPEPTTLTTEERTELIARLRTMLDLDQKIPCLSAKEARWANDMLAAKKPDYGTIAKGLEKLSARYPELDGKAAA